MTSQPNIALQPTSPASPPPRLSFGTLGDTRKALLKRTNAPAVALLIVALGVLSACRVEVSARPGYIDDDKKAAAQEIETFHHRLSAARFEDIYQDLHPTFRNNRNREQLLGSMRATRDQYGTFKTVTSSQINVVMGTPVEIRALYNTTYERGEATEQFIFLHDGAKVLLASYAVSPGIARTDGNLK